MPAQHEPNSHSAMNENSSGPCPTCGKEPFCVLPCSKCGSYLCDGRCSSNEKSNDWVFQSPIFYFVLLFALFLGNFVFQAFTNQN